MVGALPIIDAAIGDGAGGRIGRVGPDFLAGGRVERHEGVALGQHVQHAVGHHRVEGVFLAVAGGIAPGHLQLGNVGAVDLFEGRVLGRIGRAAVVAPRGVVLGKRGKGGE